MKEEIRLHVMFDVVQIKSVLACFIQDSLKIYIWGILCKIKALNLYNKVI